jgi:hypothetical protein
LHAICDSGKLIMNRTRKVHERSAIDIGVSQSQLDVPRRSRRASLQVWEAGWETL